MSDCTEKTGDEQRKTIKLSLDINDDDNDDVFLLLQWDRIV